MRVIIAGDFYPSGKVSEFISQGSYSCVLSDVKNITDHADFSIVNLECPATESLVPISKVGPALKCGVEALDALKYAGFDCVTLANNHINDYGAQGVIDTLDSLKAKGFDYVGAGKNRSEASKTLFKEISGSRLAVINCCEREFSIADPGTPGAFELDPVVQIERIRQAKKCADHVLMIIHGGYERCSLPSPRMVRTYRAFIDAGADAVINHHQHCCSGFEIYEGKPIIYGIGNICFEALATEDESWNKGVIAELDFGKGPDPGFRLIPFTQCLESPSVRIMGEKDAERFLAELAVLSAIIQDEERLDKEYAAFLSKVSLTYQGVFNYKYRLLRYLSRRGLIKSSLSAKERLMLMDYIGCDSHRDALLFFLEGNQ